VKADSEDEAKEKEVGALIRVEKSLRFARCLITLSSQIKFLSPLRLSRVNHTFVWL